MDKPVKWEGQKQENTEDAGCVRVYTIDNEIISNLELFNETISAIVTEARNYGFCQISLMAGYKEIDEIAKSIMETINSFLLDNGEIKEFFDYKQSPMVLNLPNFKEARIKGRVILINTRVIPSFRSQN